MKIRLKITAPDGSSTIYEHNGSKIRIGRHPDCELLLKEPYDTSASRFHAAIELTSEKASLIDTGSGNGVVYNNSLLKESIPLKVGDKFQLGYTGSTLHLLDLDLSTTNPSRYRSALLYASAGVVGMLLVLFVALRFGPTSPPIPETPSPEQNAQQLSQKPTPGIIPNSSHEKGKSGFPNETKIGPTDHLPSLEIKRVGYYLIADKTRPTVLLQRASENHSWSMFRSGQSVTTAQTLVSLPGYQCLLSLDSGVNLTLWGNLPEFNSFPPLFESVVMLNVPPSDIHADITLNRGRIQLANESSSTKRTVRIRFLREKWDVILNDSASAVCVELWQKAIPGKPGTSTRYLGLFSRGKVTIQTGSKEISLADSMRIVWNSVNPKEIDVAKMSAPPDWWINGNPKTPAAQDMHLCLNDWCSKYLEKSPDVIDTILTQIRESKDRSLRLVGLWFLAGLDEIAHLPEFVEDQDANFADIRNTAMLGLQDWLTRYPHQKNHLIRTIQERRGITAASAARIVSLLAMLPPDDFEKADTYQQLIQDLNHEKLAIRHLASYYLYSVLKPRIPEAALKITYDPMMEPTKREAAVAEWQKVIQPGKVPQMKRK